MERVRSSKRDSAKLDLAKRKSVKPESTKRSRIGETGFGVTGVLRKVIRIIGELEFGETEFGETEIGQTYFAEINMIRRNGQISESEFSKNGGAGCVPRVATSPSCRNAGDVATHGILPTPADSHHLPIEAPQRAIVLCYLGRTKS